MNKNTYLYICKWKFASLYKGTVIMGKKAWMAPSFLLQQKMYYVIRIGMSKCLLLID